MNIHPLFVHFPIGLLVAYSLLELSAALSSRLRAQAWVFPVKAFLLFTGVPAAFAAIVTGALAGELVETAGDPNLAIIEMHAAFALTTALLYFALAAAYLVRVFDLKGWGDRASAGNSLFIRIWSFKKRLARSILDTRFLPALALLALACITVTGALGAAVVYGPDIDPFVSFIYSLFWAK